MNDPGPGHDHVLVPDSDPEPERRVDLGRHLADYLRLRRALGYQLEFPGAVLPQFVAYLAAAGASRVSTEHAVAWARLPVGVQPVHWAHRLGAARGFARYLQTIDPGTEVAPRDVFGARQQRPVPYMWSDTEVLALLDAAGGLRPPRRGLTYKTLFGLLAVSGLRIGEALALRVEEVDLPGGLITITMGKSGRSRLIPLHPSTVEALTVYAHARRQWRPRPSTAAFFVSGVGTALAYSRVRATFVQLTTATGTRTAAARPRMHDLRHRFAVNTVIGWQRSGVDVGAHMATLSTYLGHVNPAGTYWYLTAVPELMEPAAAMLAVRFGTPR